MKPTTKLELIALVAVALLVGCLVKSVWAGNFEKDAFLAGPATLEWNPCFSCGEAHTVPGKGLGLYIEKAEKKEIQGDIITLDDEGVLTIHPTAYCDKYYKQKENCVPLSEVIETLEYGLNEARPFGGLNWATAECDPCKCMTSEAACYEYKAKQTRAKEKRYNEAVDVLNRLKEAGCVE